MVDLEKIRIRILEGTPIEKILSGFDWSGFEASVAEIFLANGFNVKRNFRFKKKRRYEIDIIASRAGGAICTDCKGWREGRNKKSAIERAAEMQKERTEHLKKFVSKHPIARNSLKIVENANYIPMVVTLLEEDVKENEGVLVVPVWKLNSFLNSDSFVSF
jgi:hypothetical protein